jgi:hypothetical protein
MDLPCGNPPSRPCLGHDASFAGAEHLPADDLVCFRGACLRAGGFRRGMAGCHVNKPPWLVSMDGQTHAGTTCMHMLALIALNPHPCIFCRLEKREGWREKRKCGIKTRVSKQKTRREAGHVPSVQMLGKAGSRRRF